MEESTKNLTTRDTASTTGKQPYTKPQLHLLSAATGTQAKGVQNPTEASPTTGPS